MSLHISSLHLYPIKGCRGHAVDSLTFDQFGVVNDRRLMLVDANGRFVSQREVPALATLAPYREGDRVTVQHDGREPLQFTVDLNGAARDVTVWNYPIRAVDQGDAAARWFSDALGAPIRLVSWGNESRRQLDPAWAPGATVQTTFTDGYPALGVTEASLDDLNARLAEPIPMERFRPTMVMRGGAAWSEDDWTALHINEMIFDSVKPCARCVVTTTDQSSGHKHPLQEPLRTLATFRTIRGLGAIFGQNLVHRGPGTIHSGSAALL